MVGKMREPVGARYLQALPAHEARPGAQDKQEELDMKAIDKRREALRQQEQQEQRSRSIKLMQTPSAWPKFSVLPMKEREWKPGEERLLGFLYCWDKVEPIVYIGNLYTLADQARKEQGVTDPTMMVKIDLTRVQQKKYLDFEALAAEWEVD
jgi:hypothetical protein